MTGAPPPLNIPRDPATKPTDAELAELGLELFREMVGDIITRAAYVAASGNPHDRACGEAILAQARALYRALGRIA